MACLEGQFVDPVFPMIPCLADLMRMIFSFKKLRFLLDLKYLELNLNFKPWGFGPRFAIPC